MPDPVPVIRAVRGADTDLHLHSNQSSDSSTSLLDMARAAEKAGLKTVCFTEHVDPHPRDFGHGFYDFDRYRTAIEAARDALAGRIEILMGIEFGEPHLFPAELERERARGYDLILGSLHFCGNWFFGEPELLQERSRADVFKHYADDLVRMAESGGFDVMAHIGFPQRYLGAYPSDAGMTRQLARAMVASGILPEINTSGLRKGYPDTLPGLDFLTAFKEAGGRQVTIGSDGHQPEDVGADRLAAVERAQKAGLALCVFRGGSAERLPEEDAL